LKKTKVPAPVPVIAAALTMAAMLTSAAQASGSAGRGLPDPNGADRKDPQVIALSPIEDNALHESADGSNSSGQGSHLFVGNTGQGVIRRAVIEFDVAGSIPAGAEIDSVTLSLNMSRTSSGAQVVRLFQLSREWGEGGSNADGNEGSGAPAEDGDATWLHTFYPDQLWSVPGGDFADTASASTSVSDLGRYEWSSDSSRPLPCRHHRCSCPTRLCQCR